MTQLRRFAHTDRHESSGRYAESVPCDACGKAIGTNYFTDDEVCGASDGPGFHLCDRVRCVKARDLPVEERRALYTKIREAARAAWVERRKKARNS